MTTAVWRVPMPRSGNGRSEPAPAGKRVGRVLFVASQLHDDSQGRGFLRMAQELVRRELSVGLLWGGGALAAEIEAMGLRSCLCEALWQPIDPLFLPKAPVAFAREFAPELVHLFGCPLARWGMRLARATRAPYVLSVTSFPPPVGEARLPGQWKQGSILALSEEVRQGLVNQGRIPKEAIGVIPMGIAIEDYEDYQESDRSNRVPVVGTVGPLAAERGCDVFLRAAQIILERGREAQFVIAGDGPDGERLRHLAAELAIENFVTFVPQYRDHRRMISVLDICVIPALEEGISLSVIEAMACRKPVVASGVGDAYDVIKDGHTGFLAAKKDPQGMAEKILHLMDDRVLARRLVEAAYTTVCERFSLDASIDHLLSFYSWCVARAEGR